MQALLAALSPQLPGLAVTEVAWPRVLLALGQDVVPLSHIFKVSCAHVCVCVVCVRACVCVVCACACARVRTRASPAAGLPLF